MLATLKDTANTKNKVSNALPQGQNLITDINTAMSITDNKAHLKVSFQRLFPLPSPLSRVFPMTEKHGSPNGFPPAHQERLEQGREAGNPFFKKDSPSSSSSSKNTLIVGVGTLISRLLGFVRDAGIAWLLGGSGAADALTAALRIPYMARRLFGEGTLSLSLTAACTRERLRGGSAAGLRWR